MSQIRAFVGHSFRDEDKSVVSAFLEFFDELTGLVPYFTWDYALAAEPKDLSEKVLRIIEDKNIFIGICTKSEIAASEGSYEPTIFRNRRKI